MAKNLPQDPSAEDETANVEIKPDVVVTDEVVENVEDEVVGFDQGGVYTPIGVNIVSTPAGAGPKASRVADSRVVFTNTRYPEQKVAVVKDGERVRGKWLKFNSTKLVVDNAADAKALEAMNLPGVYREPSGFFTSPEDKFFVHQATGFKTLSKDAYEDWVNRSEWSATPGR